MAIAAVWDTLSLLFLWAPPMAMTTSALQAARRLPAVQQHATKTLKDEALVQPILGVIGLDLYTYIVK
jgi:hypothetical protein